MASESAGRRLRELLDREQTLVMPGVFNALSARLATAAGFGGLYMSGFAVSASRAALPDDGLLTMSEMAGEAEAIVAATDVPVLADADTGYGAPTSVGRTVERYERAGVAGMHIEDMEFPKQGLAVVERTEMVDRIEAALAARSDSSLMIVGRTDSIDTLGMDEAIDRARILQSHGVDAVFVHGLKRRDEFARVREAIEVPLVANIVEGITEVVSAAELTSIGYEMAIFSISVLRGAMKVELELYEALMRGGEFSQVGSDLLPLDKVDALLRETMR